MTVYVLGSCDNRIDLVGKSHVLCLLSHEIVFAILLVILHLLFEHLHLNHQFGLRLLCRMLTLFLHPLELGSEILEG